MDLHVVVMILHVLYCPFLELTKEFLMIYERCPSRLQKKITEPMKSQVKEKVKERFILNQQEYGNTVGPNCLTMLV